MPKALRKTETELEPLGLPEVRADNIIPMQTPAPAPKPALKRLNFGGLQEKNPAATLSKYPVLPDPDGTIAELADEFLTQHAAEELANGAKEIARGQLVQLASPFHWQTNSNRADLLGTVSVRSKTGKEVLVQFKNAYKAITDIKDKAGKILQSADQRIAALPPEIFAQYFRETFSVKIDSTKIADDKLQTVVDRLTELSTELALGDAIEVSACFKPTAEWHTARYKVLTPQQNLQLEQSMGEKGLMSIAVTTARGRKQ